MFTGWIKPPRPGWPDQAISYEISPLSLNNNDSLAALYWELNHYHYYLRSKSFPFRYSALTQNKSFRPVPQSVVGITHTGLRQALPPKRKRLRSLLLNINRVTRLPHKTWEDPPKWPQCSLYVYINIHVSSGTRCPSIHRSVMRF